MVISTIFPGLNSTKRSALDIGMSLNLGYGYIVKKPLLRHLLQGHIEIIPKRQANNFYRLHISKDFLS